MFMLVIEKKLMDTKQLEPVVGKVPKTSKFQMGVGVHYKIKGKMPKILRNPTYNTKAAKEQMEGGQNRPGKVPKNKQVGVGGYITQKLLKNK